ncbi:MAG: ParA family protein [Candidatus Glassbacteria bacterium]|nr:ParA family protein [Candidatus Glassbacteria bacterium]
MKKIAIICTKGGVGKTTTTVNVGHGLSLNGKRVIMVDCDPQNNLSDIFDLESDRGVNALLMGKRAWMCEVRRNLFVIPSGGRNLIEYEWKLARQKDREKRLVYALEDLSNCDYVLMDCSSSMNLTNINVLSFADLVIIPVGMDYFSVSALKQTFELIKEICLRTGHHVRLMGILATQFDTRTRISRSIYGVLSRMFARELFSTVIHQNIRLRESPAFGQSIYEYDISCNGARDYIKLTAEILAYDG